MDRIRLTELELECIIGILDSERVTPQRLQLEVTLGLSLQSAARGHLHHSVDYAAVLDQITALAMSRWYLLESLGEAACRLFLAPPCPAEGRAFVDTVEVVMRKPDILAGRAVPEVVVRRDSQSVHLASRGLPGMVIETLLETPINGAYRVHLDPGTTWTAPDEAVLQPLAGTIDQQGQTLKNTGHAVCSVLVAGAQI